VLDCERQTGVQAISIAVTRTKDEGICIESISALYSTYERDRPLLLLPLVPTLLPRLRVPLLGKFLAYVDASFKGSFPLDTTVGRNYRCGRDCRAVFWERSGDPVRLGAVAEFPSEHSSDLARTVAFGPDAIGTHCLNDRFPAGGRTDLGGCPTTGRNRGELAAVSGPHCPETGDAAESSRSEGGSCRPKPQPVDKRAYDSSVANGG
jgi:hypothetical protein